MDLGSVFAPENEGSGKEEEAERPDATAFNPSRLSRPSRSTKSIPAFRSFSNGKPGSRRFLDFSPQSASAYTASSVPNFVRPKYVGQQYDSEEGARFLDEHPSIDIVHCFQLFQRFKRRPKRPAAMEATEVFFEFYRQKHERWIRRSRRCDRVGLKSEKGYGRG